MRGGRVLLIVGGILIVITLLLGGFWWFTMRGGEPEPTPSPDGEEVPFVQPEETEQIVVAAQNVPRGTPITEENNAVRLADWPEDSVPDGAFRDLEAVYGRLASVDLVVDMPVTEGMLAEDAAGLSSSGSDAALMTPPGRVSYALPVARWSSVAWAIAPGDHVDMLISILVVDLDEEFQTILPNQARITSQDPEGETEVLESVMGRIEQLQDGSQAWVTPSEQQRSRMVTQLTVQDAIVLKVGDWREEPTPVPTTAEETADGEAVTPTPPPLPEVDSLTVAVTPQDAAVLKYAEEMGFSMDLVLRSSQDSGQVFVTDPVTLDYIFSRFAIEVPQKLPYGPARPIETLRGGTAGEVETEAGTVDRAEGAAGEAVE